MIFIIEGYWADDHEQQFDDYLVSEYNDRDDREFRDDDIFWYGYNEASLIDAIATGQEVMDGVVITNYKIYRKT